MIVYNIPVLLIVGIGFLYFLASALNWIYQFLFVPYTDQEVERMIRCAEESFNKSNGEVLMQEKKYFTYDSEWGFELFCTPEEAQEEAQRRLNSCLDNNEGWDMLSYKGYIAVVEYDDESEIFHGEVANTKDVITFQSDNAKELRTEMIISIDTHLAFCEKMGREASKPFSGDFVVRTSPNNHGLFTAADKRSKMSLNKNNEGWAEWTDSICWGELTQKAVEVKGSPVAFNGGIIDSCDYVLEVVQ